MYITGDIHSNRWNPIFTAQSQTRIKRYFLGVVTGGLQILGVTRDGARVTTEHYISLVPRPYTHAHIMVAGSDM